MRVTYIVSGLTTSLTFVVNEMESHEKAGWTILPIVSCKPYPFQNLSKVMLKWNKKAVFRPGLLKQLIFLIGCVISHPFRFLKVLQWLFILLINSPTEFVKALLEFSVLGYYARQCQERNIEHIHVHFASRSLSLGLMLGILLDIPVSCTAHAFDIFMRSGKSLRYRMKQCKFISTISQYNIQYLRKKCGDEIADLCEIVHCGIDVSKFKVGSEKRNSRKLVSVARLCKKKGFDVAIQACNRLNNEGVDFTFEIVGDGPERDYLLSLIKEYNLDHKVKLLGAKNNDEIIPLISSAGIFLMPCVKDENGDMDGIPVAMMEAMACGTPVVSSKISGIPDLVLEGVNGFLVEQNDSVSVAEKVKRLINSQELISQFGFLARQHVEEQFDMEKNAEKLRELILHKK